MKRLLTLLLFSIILFILGYNSTFNSKKTMSKFDTLSRYNERNILKNIISSEERIFWVKVCGIGMMIFALILLIIIILLVFNVIS